MERNRINFAKYQIFRYVEEMFTCISDLLNPEIEMLMNMESHGLREDELKVLLFQMFTEHMLVALKEDRGLFTPTLEEIEAALHEEKDLLYHSNNTFYGFTTGAIETFHELKAIYGEK